MKFDNFIRIEQFLGCLDNIGDNFFQGLKNKFYEQMANIAVNMLMAVSSKTDLLKKISIHNNYF